MSTTPTEIGTARSDAQADGKQIVVTCPADGHVVGSVPNMGPEDVAALARELRAAQPEWEAMGPKGRAVWLGRFRDWFIDNQDRILRLIQREMGKAWADASIEAGLGMMVVNYYTKNAEKFLTDEHPRPAHPSQLTKRLTTRYTPYPLVGVICPWNWPLIQPMLDVPQALAAGCAVLSKPSEVAPLTWVECVRAWRDEIGAPNVLGCATGDGAAGEAVIDVVDMIQFTGSVRTGRKVGARAGERLIPCELELGGNDPMIVLADADLERAANGATWGACVNSGQGCIAVERAYVEAPIYDEFVRMVAERFSGLRQGMDSSPFQAELGAMASEAQLEIVERHVNDAIAKGARTLTGGKRREGDGLFFPPTVLVDVDHTMEIMREETFGPTLPIMRVADAAEAVRMANDSSYGLSASVWTKNRAKAETIARRLEAGGVCINNHAIHAFQMPLPMGGWKDSGVGGRFGGAHGIRKYCRAQAIVSDRIEPKSEPHWYPYSPVKNKIIGRIGTFVEARDWRRRLGLKRSGITPSR
jgi:acyl-CoA reductase-like NAD-dependent aldehyde dehydrogenase